MEHFRICEDVLRLVPDLQVVVVTARGINNLDANADINDLREEVWREVQPLIGNMREPSDHPRIARHRSILEQVARISPRRAPQPNEVLYKQVLKNKRSPRSLNPVIDLQNSLSLRFGLSIGGFDLESLRQRDSSPMELRFSRQGDVFLAYDEPESGTARPVPSGDMVYAQGSQVLRRQLGWKQSMHGLISRSTKDVILICEILEGRIGEAHSADLARSVAQQLQWGLRTCFGVDSKAAVLGVGPRVSTMRV